MVPQRRALGALFLILARDAYAWETDQLTDRAVPPADVTVQANAFVDGLLREAVARTNQATQCRATVERTHEVLAAQIRRVTSIDTPVPGRGFFRSLGYSVVSAWLETADLPRRSFPARDDIFGGIPGGIAPILAASGTSSTVRLGGVLMGTDKADHFFETGWRYWLHGGGDHPEEAVAWGTWTENTFLGTMTSDGFSYADLVANEQGYVYYDTLLDPGVGDFAIGDDGCVAQVRGFDFARWVDWRWDELINPTVYTRKVAAWLDAHLDAHRDDICRDAASWIDDVLAHRDEMLAEGPGSRWASASAPPRVDVFDLERRCAPEIAAGARRTPVTAQARRAR